MSKTEYDLKAIMYSAYDIIIRHTTQQPHNPQHTHTRTHTPAPVLPAGRDRGA